MPPGTDDIDKDPLTTKDSLPEFPGEDFLAHNGSQWLEAAEARLIGRALLAVANGELPASVKQIIDIDLTTLPPLPTTHPGHERRLETLRPKHA